MLNMHFITFPVQHHELRGSPQAVMQASEIPLCLIFLLAISPPNLLAAISGRDLELVLC